jgi:hypothetical protein
MDPKAPNAKVRTTPQYAMYQRENFWKVNDGEVPLFNTGMYIELLYHDSIYIHQLKSPPKLL